MRRQKGFEPIGSKRGLAVFRIMTRVRLSLGAGWAELPQRSAILQTPTNKEVRKSLRHRPVVWLEQRGTAPEGQNVGTGLHRDGGGVPGSPRARPSLGGNHAW